MIFAFLVVVRCYCNQEGKIVVSLGCFIGDFSEAKEAITNKYGDGKEAKEYIKKVKLAFDYLAKKTK